MATLSFKMKTAAGDVDYYLRRLTTSGPFHYNFYWKAERYRESTKTGDLKQARAAAERAIEKVLNASRVVGQSWALAAAVDAFLDDLWPEHLRSNNRTYQGHKSRLKAFAKSHGGVVVSGATFEDFRAVVQAYIDTRKDEKNAKGETISAENVDNDRRSISRFCSWLIEKKYVGWAGNPAQRKGLRAPTVAHAPKRPASADSAAAVIEKAKGHALYPVLILVSSGMRPIGCTRVLWKHIRFGAKPYIDRAFEKKRARDIPLSQWAAKALQACKGSKTDDQRVFPYHIDVATKYLRQLRKGIDETLTFYPIRRLANMRLYQAGVPPQVAAKIMGNSVEVQMRHYVDLEALDAHEHVEALAPPSKTVKKRSKLRTRLRR